MFYSFVFTTYESMLRFFCFGQIKKLKMGIQHGGCREIMSLILPTYKTPSCQIADHKGNASGRAIHSSSFIVITV